GLIDIYSTLIVVPYLGKFLYGEAIIELPNCACLIFCINASLRTDHIFPPLPIRKFAITSPYNK
ncbi:TPA: hypothetical protein ACV2AJ_005064, partial [Escherichia coli]